MTSFPSCSHWLSTATPCWLLPWPAWAMVILLFGPGLALADEPSQPSSLVIDETPLTAADRDHWSFQPIKHPRVPALGPMERAGRPIDAFLVKEMIARQLVPVAPASRRVLARRLFQDLTGLPPDPSEVELFVADPRPDATERLIDRLLASPHHGEHEAQTWLDLARFAETDGFEHDKVRPEAWKYRDWVIQAINEDLGYDQFIALQLAGDEIAPEDADANIATAFCLAGPDMPDINSQDERKNHLLNGMIANVGSVFMGLQIGCAQCHEHKFDPISHADFYRMRAIFEPAVNVKKNVSVSTLAEAPAFSQKSHLRIRGEWNRIGPEVHPAFLRIANASGTDLEAVTESLPGATSRRRWALATWLTTPNHPLTSRVMVNRIWQDHFGFGLCHSPSDFGYMGDSPTHPELLDWLARELIKGDWSVKRMHRKVLCTDAYQRASHPEVQSKTVPSPTEDIAQQFTRAIEQDRRNRYLSYYPRQRLTGEALRDNLLKISGSLNTQQGGPGIRPPLPQELRGELLKGQWEVTSDSAQHRRRSIYVFARRNLRLPIFDAFDRPDANESCARRYQSTTALQSLQLWNSEFSSEIAEELAHRLDAEAGGDEDKVRLLFDLTVSRAPAPNEVQEILSFIHASDRTHHLQRWADVCLAMLNTNEFLYID